MNFKLLADISKSLLMARWRQSLVAAIGVTFSIAMFVSLLGFMNGLNDLLDGLIINRTPHVRIFNEIKPNPKQPITIAEAYQGSFNFISSLNSSGGRLDIYDNAAIIKAIRNDPRVLGLAPKLNAPVLYNSGTIDITGTVSGIDVVAESQLFFFSDYVTTGSAIDIRNISNSRSSQNNASGFCTYSGNGCRIFYEKK